MNTLRRLVILGLGALTVLAVQVCLAQMPPAEAPPFQGPPPAPAAAASPAKPEAPRTIAPYFVAARPGAKAPDADGFLQRWLLLEPINKPNRTNTVFVDSYVRKN